MNNNITNFPLYKILHDEVKKHEEEPTTKDKELFIKFIESKDDELNEIVYTIIRLYDLKNKKKSSSTLYNIPYNGKNVESKNHYHSDNNYTFDFDSFPSYLQKMLIHFMKINNC
jgi:hypothetical protein